MYGLARSVSCGSSGTLVLALAAGLGPTRLRGLAGARASLFGGHLRGSRVTTDQPALMPTLDSRRVLDLLRLGGSLPSGEVYDGLGSLVGIAWHGGLLHRQSIAGGDA